MPRNAEEWEHIASDFMQKWNFPNCLGALNGKHIRIKLPFHSGSAYYNYKGFFSIILMAPVDADYTYSLSASSKAIAREKHFCTILHCG